MLSQQTSVAGDGDFDRVGDAGVRRGSGSGASTPNTIAQSDVGGQSNGGWTTACKLFINWTVYQIGKNFDVHL